MRAIKEEGRRERGTSFVQKKLQSNLSKKTTIAIMFCCFLNSTWNPKANTLWNTRGSMKPASITAVAWWKKEKLRKKWGNWEKWQEGKRRGEIWFKVSRGISLFLGVVWCGTAARKSISCLYFFPRPTAVKSLRDLFPLLGFFLPQANGGLWSEFLSFLFIKHYFLYTAVEWFHGGGKYSFTFRVHFPFLELLKVPFRYGLFTCGEADRS